MDEDGRHILLMLQEQQILQREQLVLLAQMLSVITWLVKNPVVDGGEGDEGGPEGPAPGQPSVKDHRVQPVEPEYMRGFQ